MDLPQYDDVLEATKRIAPFAVRTPLLTAPRLNQALGGTILVKAEPLQVTGSFKFRGACNSIQMLGDDVKTVVAWSSGNHAQAVAYAARTRGLRAIIVMPEDAPAAKITGTKELGGEVVTYDRYSESREDIGAALAAEHNATVIPPYDYLPTIAGQGTIGIEIAQQLDEMGMAADQLICCTGGGGLLAGLSLGLHHHKPDIKIYGAEPEGFDDFKKSLDKGERVANDPKNRSICDAIVTAMPGEMTFPINQDHVTNGLVVSDDDALDTIAVAYKHLKIIIEPGGAVALAAALKQKIDITGKTTVVVASGGNVDKEMFDRALARL